MMTVVWQVLLFSVAATFTPGPNSMLLASSGATFGFRRSVRALMGVCLGIPLLIFAVGLGLGSVLLDNDYLRVGLKVVGAVYMLWLAWKIATANPNARAANIDRPVGAFQAALFQWVNPKVWGMAISMVGAYSVASADQLQHAAVIAGVFAVVAVPAAVTWTLFGTVVRRLLVSHRAFRAFNVTMALLMVVSLVPIVLNH